MGDRGRNNDVFLPELGVAFEYAAELRPLFIGK